MDEKIKSKIASKLITRSKTKTSKSHKKIVAMLNNLSKDKSGAPVSWKFNKSGIKQANKVAKRLQTAQDKELQKDPSTSSESRKTDIDTNKLKSEKNNINSDQVIQKRKPGRPKIIRNENQQSESNNDISNTVTQEEASNFPTEGRLENTQKSGRGRKKKILSKDIRIKRLEILKRHIERGRGRGRGRIKRIRELHSIPVLEKEDSDTDDMDGQNRNNINQDKLKLLKEQIDSERKRGRGRGRGLRGRPRINLPGIHSSIINVHHLTTQADHPGGDSELKPLRSRGRGRGRGRVKKGRRPWKHLNAEVRTDTDMQQISSTSEQSSKPIGRPFGRRGRGPRWTSLNRQALNKSVLNEHTRAAISSGNLNFGEQLNETPVDSENESIDSNLSSASSKARKRKLHHHMGIKLGPSKMLRSQDSMKTRIVKNLSGLPVLKKRKRTLSGEFDLLDEKTLRKQMRGKDDDDNSVAQSFDGSWADVTDSEYNESQIDNIYGESDSDIQDSQVKSDKGLIFNETNLSETSKKYSHLQGIKLGRRKGRPPKILSNDYEIPMKMKKNAKDFTSVKSSYIRQNKTGRLTIIGPGGIQFVKVRGQHGKDEVVYKMAVDTEAVNCDLIEKYNDTYESNAKEEIITVQIVHDESLKENIAFQEKNIKEKLSGYHDDILQKEVDVKSIESVKQTKDNGEFHPKEILTTEAEISPETILLSLKQVKQDKTESSKIKEETPIGSDALDKLGGQKYESEMPSLAELVPQLGAAGSSIQHSQTQEVESMKSENNYNASKTIEVAGKTETVSQNISELDKSIPKQEERVISIEAACVATTAYDNFNKLESAAITSTAIDSTQNTEVSSFLGKMTDKEEKNKICQEDEIVDKVDDLTDEEHLHLELLSDDPEIGEVEEMSSNNQAQRVVSDILEKMVEEICGKTKSEYENMEKDENVIEKKEMNKIEDENAKDNVDSVNSNLTMSIETESAMLPTITNNAEKTNIKQLTETIPVDSVLNETNNTPIAIMEDKTKVLEEEEKSINEGKKTDELTGSIEKNSKFDKTSDGFLETSTGDNNQTEIKESNANENIDDKEGKSVPIPTEVLDKSEESASVSESAELLNTRKRKIENETDSKSESESTQESVIVTTPETSGKTEVKRVFQLRKKASRSPLEIIAMKHSLEERKYMLEETQRAIRREEKQKKMFQNKLLREKIEQLSPPKHSIDQLSPPKQTEQLQHVQDCSPEKVDELAEAPTHLCKPCSIVLIDFVKYLKMSDHSEKPTPDRDHDDMSTTEDEATTDTEGTVNVKPKHAHAEVENNVQNNSTQLGNDSKDATQKSAIEGSNPPVKRPAKARKQAKSYNYSSKLSKLTAEIVSSPEPTDIETKTFTVPPLILKIKQKEKVKKKFKGHKWTAPRNRARKQMTPFRRILPKQTFEFETLGSKDTAFNFEDSSGKVMPTASTLSQVPNPATTVVANQGLASEYTENNSANISLQAMNKNSSENMFRFKCNYKNCEFKSQKRNLMESHIYIHLNSPFKCSHCDEIFPSRNAAFNHSKKAHCEKELKIITVDTVDESNYYEEINTPKTSENSNVIQADIQDVQHSSESLIISVRLPRNVNDSATGCYCCCHCDFSASKVKDINTHVEQEHRENIQYLCSVCNKSVSRYGEGIARHFSNEHPDQPVAYKSLPDYYDVRKTIEKPSSGDKGNIFDRMSDLFSGKKGSKTFTEKTSAEADSTTAENDEDITSTDSQPSADEPTTTDHPDTSKKTVEPVHHEPDGIEQLAQMYGNPTSTEGDKTVSEDTRNASVAENPNQLLDDNSGNDMGLKIVDVVSLQGGSDFAKDVWGETAETSKPPPIPIQMPVNRPPVLVPTSSLRHQLQANNRPLLSMPQRMPYSQPSIMDSAKLKETTTTYKCEKCNVHAPVLSSMVEHLRTGHKEIPRLFLCPFCRQYEGATEPDIHKHIKQFHPSPNTKSPPVALSSDAKQHLRTIEVPVGDTQKVDGKYLIEKDIYKCLKCKRHMPSLDYIYEHLEKEHNEVFVYVCPDCKRFRAKEEEVVFNHIKTVHNKNTDDIILSLAIEENLFTRVQCLIKDKTSQNKSTSQKQIPPPLTSQSNQLRQGYENMAVPSNRQPSMPVPSFRQQSMPVPSIRQQSMPVPSIRQQSMVVPSSRQQPMPIPSSRHQPLPVYHQRPPQPSRPPMQPVFPGMIQSQPVRMPGPVPGSIAVHSQSSNQPINPTPPINKAASRKSYRPVHIPQQQNTEPTQAQTLPHSDGRKITSPPPLMRGPPPLIRFPGNNSQPQSQVVPSSTSIRHTNFTMTDKVQRLHTQSQGQSMSSNVSPPPQSRPVLKVPSVPIRRSVTSPNQQSDGKTSEGGGAPLDLSRNSTPNSQHDNSEDMDDMSPDAFQIFNLQPARQPTPNIRPVPYSQMHGMQQQRPQQIGQYNPSAYNRPGMYNQMYRAPPPYPQSYQRPHHPSPNQLSGQKPAQPLKCPYCPSLVPLSMGEVAPHIQKYHPGQKIQYVKKD
ncbi:golgin subfamily A member 4-like isoform X1 [Mytilus edulis]|uniref:golgin subfamily A member 4-like isoform X1 n=2 Tax=Mytilus edulis TaxID=6550 RepID=UPI0039F02C5B